MVLFCLFILLIKGLISGNISVSIVSKSSFKLFKGSKVFLVSLLETTVAMAKTSSDIKMSMGKTFLKAPRRLSISLETLSTFPSSSLKLT